LIPSPEYELNSNPKVTVIFASSVGNASRHNDGSSISADLHRANNQGHDERNDRGNDVANEDGNDRGNKNGKDNTEDVGDTNHGDANTTILGRYGREEIRQSPDFLQSLRLSDEEQYGKSKLLTGALDIQRVRPAVPDLPVDRTDNGVRLLSLGKSVLQLS